MRVPEPGRGPARPDVLQGRAWEAFTGSLVWPGLLRAAGLALRPARLGMAFVLVMTLAILVVLGDAWVLRGHPEGVRGLGEIIKDQLSVAAGRLGTHQVGPGMAAILMLPARLFREHPAITMVLTLPVAAVSAVLGGAIGRSAACEFGRSERAAWLDVLSLSLRRWWTQAAAVLLPMVLMGAVSALLAVVGKVLLGYGATSWLGGLLFGAGVLVALVLVLCLLVFVLALPMLVPAVLVEGTDSIDSIQRCAAYVVGQPLRLIGYSLLLLFQALIVAALLGAAVKAAFVLAGTLGAMFLPDPYDAMVRQAAIFGTLPTLGLDAGEYPAWQSRVATMIVFWRGVFTLLPAVYAASYFYTAGSVLYLSMRRVCDGQDAGELWDPMTDESSTPRATAGTAEEEL